MKKIGVNSVGIIVSLILIYAILPTAFGVCDYSVSLLGNQIIELTATPNDPVNYYYLWTQNPANGILPFTPTDQPGLTLKLPPYNPGGVNHYEVTVKVTNKHPVTGTCTDQKTICIDVHEPTCPICDGDACVTSEPVSPNCPPYFHYGGYIDPDGLYTFTYETLPHSGYLGQVLHSYTGLNGDFTMSAADWAKLDQPTASNTHVCTDIKFSITEEGNVVGEPCTRTICLNWNPTAGIDIEI